MSTIDTLLAGGRLRPVDFGLLDDELPERGLVGTERFFGFLTNELPSIPSQDAMLSALEQLASLFNRYLTNTPLILNSPISPLRHLEDAVWEFKTLDVRVFGWAVRKDYFVVDSGCDTKKLKAGNINYSAFINQTTWVRKNLGFQSGTYITGSHPSNVIEKFVIPPRPKGGAVHRRR